MGLTFEPTHDCEFCCAQQRTKCSLKRMINGNVTKVLYLKKLSAYLFRKMSGVETIYLLRRYTIIYILIGYYLKLSIIEDKLSSTILIICLSQCFQTSYNRLIFKFHLLQFSRDGNYFLFEHYNG